MASPVHKEKVGGVEAAVWKNERSVGEGETKRNIVDFSVSIQRSYKDKNDAWQHSQSLREADLPKAIIALQRAYEKIVCDRATLGKEPENAGD